MFVIKFQVAKQAIVAIAINIMLLMRYSLLLIATCSRESFAERKSESEVSRETSLSGQKRNRNSGNSGTTQEQELEKFSFANYASYVRKTHNVCKLIEIRREILKDEQWIEDCEQEILENWIKEEAGFSQLQVLGYRAALMPITNQDEKVTILKKIRWKHRLNDKEKKFVPKWQAEILEGTKAIVHSNYLNGAPDKNTRDLFATITSEDSVVVQTYLFKYGNLALNEICDEISSTFFEPIVKFIAEPAGLFESPECQYFCQNENGINEEKTLNDIGKCVEVEIALVSYFRVAIAKVEKDIEKRTIKVHYVIAFDNYNGAMELQHPKLQDTRSFPQVVASLYGTYDGEKKQFIIDISSLGENRKGITFGVSQPFSFANFASYVERTRGDRMLIKNRSQILVDNPSAIEDAEIGILKKWIEEDAGLPQLDFKHGSAQIPIIDKTEKVEILKRKIKKEDLTQAQIKFVSEWREQMKFETWVTIQSNFMNGFPDKITRDLFNSINSDDSGAVGDFLRSVYGNSDFETTCETISENFFKSVKFRAKLTESSFLQIPYFCQHENGFNEERRLFSIGNCEEVGNPLSSYFRLAVAKVEQVTEKDAMENEAIEKNMKGNDKKKDVVEKDAMKKDATRKDATKKGETKKDAMKKYAIKVHYVIAFDKYAESMGLKHTSFHQVVASFSVTYAKQENGSFAITFQDFSSLGEKTRKRKKSSIPP